MASFFYCGRLSSAQLDCWQAPKQRPIIDQRPIEQTAFQREIKDLVTMDINPSLQILGWYVKAHVSDKGIRQKSTKRVNSFIACSAFCPGPWPQGLWETMAFIHINRHDGTPRHAWCVYKSSGKTHKNRNACIDASSIGRPNKNFAGLYTASDANWLIQWPWVPLSWFRNISWKGQQWLTKGWWRTDWKFSGSEWPPCEVGFRWLINDGAIPIQWHCIFVDLIFKLYFSYKLGLVHCWLLPVFVKLTNEVVAIVDLWLKVPPVTGRSRLGKCVKETGYFFRSFFSNS